MFNKKGAIGLAMNTIVVVIISLVILTSGILLLRSWMEGAEDIKAQLDQRTQDELLRLLVDQGKKVALPLHTATLQAGESHVFGLGIQNIDDEQYGTDFIVDVSLSKLIDTSGEITYTSSGSTEYIRPSWVLYETTNLKIKENDHHSVPIFVDVPLDAVKGTYIFNVRVFYTGTESYSDSLEWSSEGQYDSIKKFYLTVT